MAEIKRSIFVIPSSSLEDLPKRMGHDQALDFLTAWTAQWDPRLLAGLETLPEWKKGDVSALDVEDALIVCPSSAKSKIDQPLRERLELGRCVVIDTAETSRAELADRLISAAQLVSVGDATHPTLIEDFYALGYAVLQIQILAKKLRYSWNIDWVMFTEQTLSAARAALANDTEETERWIQACFDSLSQERDRYCSQQAYLLDIVLLANTTLGASLDRQLASDQPINFLASASLLKTLQEKNPAAFQKIKQGVEDKNATIVGGVEYERPHSYMSSPSIVRDLQKGIRAYAELGCGIPKVFSRYGAGFISTTPTWLTHFAYQGALLEAWSDGVVPDKDQAKIRWQPNSEGTSVDTIIGHVLDASSADTYIDLADALSSQLDYHHVPTLLFAHWPGAQSQPQQDLLRVIARSPSLGKFHTAENYFASTNQPYSGDYFPANAFKVAIPKQVAEQNQLHLQLARYERLRVQVERMSSLCYLWEQVAGQSAKNAARFSSTKTKVVELLQQIDTWFDSEKNVAEASLHISTDLSQQIASCKEELLEQIRISLGGRASESGGTSSTATGYLIVNPSNHPQRLFLEDVPGVIDASSCTRIQACESSGQSSRLVVDVPPYGFVRMRLSKAVGSNDSAKSASPKVSLWSRMAGARRGIAESDWTLANEFMEVQIDPKRGHLRSVYIPNKRGSRLSGMSSIVSGSPDVNRKWNDADCTDLSNIEIKVIRSTPLVGTIEVSGDAKLANGINVQMATTYTLWKGSRWVDVEIQAKGLPIAEASVVWRSAWLNEGATVSAWQQGIKGKLQSPLQSCVELIEIDDAEHRIYLAPRGISSHRRSESRFLISSFPIDEAGNAVAKFSIGMDWPRPYETASDNCDSPWIVAEQKPADSSPDSGAWLAQCSLSNVFMRFDDTQPVLSEDQFKPDEADTWRGKTGDACVWVHETQGKSGSAKLSFFRDVAEAWRVDCHGREFDTLSVVGGQILISVKAHEQSRILLRWLEKGGVASQSTTAGAASNTESNAE